MHSPKLTSFAAPLALAFLALAAEAALPTLAFADMDDKRMIVIAGRGEASAAPDMAQVRVGVVSENETAAETVADNTKAMSKLFDVLDDLNIDEKDIQTSNFSVQPRYKKYSGSNQGRDEIDGYRVFNQLTVKVRDLDRLGAVLDGMISKGQANQLNGVAFSIAEPEPLLDQARANAVGDALRKASLYAAAAQVELGEILIIQEGGSAMPRPMYQAMGRAEIASADVPIAAGENTLMASVSLTFEIK
jgi:hypothetical protein